MRTKTGSEYTPNTLHHVVSGIMRHLRQECNKPEINFFKDIAFADFRASLDAEMKRLQAAGVGSTRKQAEPLSTDDEELLWEKNLLGDSSPASLLNSMIFMSGLYFALRSGGEHRQLRHQPCQIELVENPNERTFLRYTEDISKNHPGGLKGRKHKQKVVIHHTNVDNPGRCFVRLFKLYNQLCPADRPHDAFYLTPLKTPKQDCWFSRSPVGHNTLKNFMKNLCKQAGIQGFKTNHSLCATAATRLYSEGVDEQLVMERTGHRSIEGVRSYKRTSQQQKENVSDILNLKKPRMELIPYAQPESSRNSLSLQPSLTSFSQPTSALSSTTRNNSTLQFASRDDHAGALHLTSNFMLELYSQHQLW